MTAANDNLSSHNEGRTWFVLVCGLPISQNSFELGPSLILRRLTSPLTVFDLAAAGAVGFREWACLEPLAASATAEIESSADGATLPGYDSLNRCWLVSALLVIRGFARHICPATAGYSWNFVAGHQAAVAPKFRQQLRDEGVQKAVFEPRAALPSFEGGLLDYHLRLLLPKEVRLDNFDAVEARWISTHFESFNQLASASERFRLALESAVDWRFARDPRAALARVWSGIESLFALNSELVFRVSLHAAAVTAPRGNDRLAAFRKIKSLYGIRSKAVHGEPITDEKVFSALHESFEVLRSLLLDAVERGALRTDEELIESLLC